MDCPEKHQTQPQEKFFPCETTGQGNAEQEQVEHLSQISPYQPANWQKFMRNNIWKRQMKVAAFILWEEHQEALGSGMNDGFLFNKGLVNKAAIRDFLSEGQGAIG